MINEYLFLSDEHKSDVKALKFDDVNFEINNIKKTDLWTVRCSVAGKSEDSARKLSDVHDKLITYGPKVLSCESSQYFNNSLYPLLNEFERKLRKLLYLADAITDKDGKNIGELEKQDFGEIFDLLFIDGDFINKLKTRVNAPRGSEYEGKVRYSKSEIVKFINDATENTLWDKIFDKNDVPTLKKRFRDIQTYRNDIMHAHNIGKKTYGKIRYLFNKVNNEIDIAVGKRINYVWKEDTNTNVNEAIYSALQKRFNAYEAVGLGLLGFGSAAAPLAASLYSLRCMEQMGKEIEILNNPKLKALQKHLNSYYHSPEYIEFCNFMIHKFKLKELKISPHEIFELQRLVAELEDLKRRLKDLDSEK